MSETPRKGINGFSYRTKSNRDIYGDTWNTFLWELTINGVIINGESASIRQAYRHAKRAVRRYRKMWNLLNPNEPRI